MIETEDCLKWSTTQKPILDANGKPTGQKDYYKVVSPTLAAEAIIKDVPMRFDEKDHDRSVIWWFDEDSWLPDGEHRIDSYLRKTFKDGVNSSIIKETIGQIRARIDTVKFDSAPYLMPLQNGVLNLQTGEFRNYMPEDYLTFKYAGSYLPDKPLDKLFLWQLCSTMKDPRDVLTLIDILTSMALRIPFSYFALLFGNGNNGKGIFEKACLALFTMSRATSIELNEIKGSRFGPGALLDKDLWIVSEVSGVKDAINVLKKTSSGEMLDTDVKYKGRVQGIPHIKTILDANNAFEFGDDSFGRKRRAIVLFFLITFGDAEDLRPINRRLDEKIKQPEVLESMIRIIKARAPALIESRQIYCKDSPEEMSQAFERQNNSVKYFCDDCLSTKWIDEKQEPQRLTVDAAYSQYLRYCELYSVTKSEEKKPFGKYIAQKYDIKSVSTTEKGQQYRYYPDLYLVEYADTAYVKASNYKKIPCSCLVVDDEVKKSLYSAYNISLTTTTTTELKGIIDEIISMYKFIQSCKNEHEITYANYLKSLVVVEVGEEEAQTITVFDVQQQLQQQLQVPLVVKADLN